MKNLLALIVAAIFVTSCNKNESSFYSFEETNEVSTILLTEDESGQIIEIDNLNSVENLGFSSYEFFIMQEGFLPIRDLTINHDTIMTINFNNPSIPVDIRDFPFSGNKINELGLIIEDDRIVQYICFDLSVGPNIVSSLNANFCNSNNPKEEAENIYLNLELGENDTLAYTVIEHIFRRNN